MKNTTNSVRTCFEGASVTPPVPPVPELGVGPMLPGCLPKPDPPGIGRRPEPPSRPWPLPAEPRGSQLSRELPVAPPGTPGLMPGGPAGPGLLAIGPIGAIGPPAIGPPAIGPPPIGLSPPEVVLDA